MLVVIFELRGWSTYASSVDRTCQGETSLCQVLIGLMEKAVHEDCKDGDNKIWGSGVGSYQNTKGLSQRTNDQRLQGHQRRLHDVGRVGGPRGTPTARRG